MYFMNIFKKRKIRCVILVIVVLAIIVFMVGYAIVGEFEVEGELYPTSTEGLEIAKAISNYCDKHSKYS